MTHSPEQERLSTLRQQAFRLAYAERINELRGVYVARFDKRGLHPYSVLWGQLIALGESGESPEQMRRVARASADLDFHDAHVEEAEEHREALSTKLAAAKRESEGSQP